MNRREALKIAGVTAVVAAVGAEAKMLEEHMNRLEMKPKDAKGYTLVEITIGQGGIIHPSTPDHWIDFIELYADDKLVGKNMLEPEISRGATSFAVKLDGVKVLKARSGCNLHGIWTTTVTL